MIINKIIKINLVKTEIISYISSVLESEENIFKSNKIGRMQ